MGYIRVRPVGRSIAEKMGPALSRDAPKHTRTNRDELLVSLSRGREKRRGERKIDHNCIGKIHIQKYASYICFGG